ncbi:MAG: hypothetical protein M1831_001509 [Alyxoria varia]|nr:MAG: hypothetical protein M1831_001509 [Alyxoria varia]
MSERGGGVGSKWEDARRGVGGEGRGGRGLGSERDGGERQDGRQLGKERYGGEKQDISQQGNDREGRMGNGAGISGAAFKGAGTKDGTGNSDISSSRNPSTTNVLKSLPTVVNETVSGSSSGGSRHIDKKSPEYIIKSGIAGGFAGCAAKTAVAPLDRVKILFQASNPHFAKYTGSLPGAFHAAYDIYTSAGLRGLFRGHSATLLRIFPYAGIKFLAYEQVRAVFIPTKQQETSVRRFVSGSLAGVCSVLATYPLEVIRVRLAWETKSTAKAVGFRDICWQIYHERPPSYRAASEQKPHPPPQAPLATASPFSVVSPLRPPPSTSSGLKNFYRGFTPTLWGMLPYAGSSFLTHDLVGDFLRRPDLAPYTTLPREGGGRDESGGCDSKRPQLTTPSQLLAGGLAGLVSQTASYPLEVIRRRMQVSGAAGAGSGTGGGGSPAGNSAGSSQTMAQVARQVFRDGGVKGFFVGLGIGYLKVIPMVSVSFWAYERGKWVMGIV